MRLEKFQVNVCGGQGVLVRGLWIGRMVFGMHAEVVSCYNHDGVGVLSI